MSINPKTGSVRKRSFQKLENAASAALLATAVFAAAPRSAQAVVYLGTGNQSWFNDINWATNNATSTGTLPEIIVPLGTNDTAGWIGINANNATMPTIGVLFDPANDPLTPGGANANYVADISNPSVLPSAFTVSNTSVFTNPQGNTSQPNKLTIESGTLETWIDYIGRDGQGIIVQNGGVFSTSQKIAIESDEDNATMGSGTYEYHGGTLIAGNEIQLGLENVGNGLGVTSAGVGKLIVYNDGPAGAILVTNGITVGLEQIGAGTVGIAEFHYDLNPEGIANTRPIQNDFNTTNGALVLNNATNVSSRLNLVLDTSPGTITSPSDSRAHYLNLGLFKDQTITGLGTFPKLFYTLTTDNAYTQGATISAAFSGSTYSWTISYSGVIAFDNTATSAYTSSDISATGGSDVVLLGITALVPEPGSIALLGWVGSVVLARRRNKIIERRNTN
jgi:hypothetical protein